MSNLTPTQQEALNDLPADKDGMLDFGDVARDVLNQQCQYASYYVSGVRDTPILTADLRIEGDAYNYHSLRIHKDDAPVFVQRVNQHRANRGLI